MDPLNNSVEKLSAARDGNKPLSYCDNPGGKTAGENNDLLHNLNLTTS